MKMGYAPCVDKKKLQLNSCILALYKILRVALNYQLYYSIITSKYSQS